MIWLTYRQHRLELGALMVGALAVAFTVIAVAQYVAGVRADVGLNACPVINTEECSARLNEFLLRTSQLTRVAIVLSVFPALVAAFVAPPIFSRDFERGIHRLVWTQGIARMRWVLTKLAIVFGVAVIAGLILAMVGVQVRELPNRTVPWMGFDVEGPAVVSYLVFAIALGAALGVLIRRTVLAMLASLLVFVGVRILIEWKLRPNFLPPVAVPAGGPNVTGVSKDAWYFGTQYVYPSGADFPQQQFDALMRNFHSGDLYSYLRANDVISLSFYHPADRYWLFQSIEAAIFVGLSLLLVLLTVWVVRRRA